MTQKHDKVREEYLRSHANRTYQPGERVLVKVLPHDKDKLSSLWMGPCEVMKHVVLDKYEVRTPKEFQTLHDDCFKPYQEPLEGSASPFHYYKPRRFAEEEEAWVVERILDHRKRKGELQRLVKWKNSDKQT